MTTTVSIKAQKCNCKNAPAGASAFCAAVGCDLAAASETALLARGLEFAYPDDAILALCVATADDLRFMADGQSAPTSASPAVMERTLYRLAARVDALAELCRRSIGGVL